MTNAKTVNAQLVIMWKVQKAGAHNMNLKNIVNQLKSRYPGKSIVKNNKIKPTEILCEIEPTKNHPEYSLAIAIIDKSTPHYHEKLKEEYKIIRGNLTLHVDNKTVNLKRGDEYTVLPRQTHWAEGNETWEDHIFL